MSQTGSGTAEIVQAPAKLTVSLRVLGRRPGGLHEIEAEMVSVSLADTLVFSEGDGMELHSSDFAPELLQDIPLGEANLVSKALRGCGERAHVRLHKRILPGAGLGGGSSDAAAVLRWAASRGQDSKQLRLLAARLGSDVPFCISGGRALVGGVGERIVPLDFVPRQYALVTPPVGVSTAAAYARWDELGGPTSASGNDLEPAALSLEPALALWKDALAEAVGGSPLLAGSGSTWFVEVKGGPEDTTAEAETIGVVRIGDQTAPIQLVRTLPPLPGGF